MKSPTFSRRAMLGLATRATAAVCFGSQLAPLWAAPRQRRFKIGACDWSIGKMGDVSGLELARQLGLDGLQVSLGSAADDMRLRKPEVQRQYQEAAARYGAEIGSLAIGELNNVAYKSDPRAEAWVADSIGVCRDLGCKVILLAFFYKNDLRDDAAGVEETVKRLKRVAPKAEKAGVILGIESWLSAEKHMEIIDRVGSSAVKVYYDVANSTEMGYDICREIRKLGKEQICEFHMKENGALLGAGKVDFRKVRDAIEEIDYSGWMQIEGAVPEGQAMLESYQKNRAFLRDLFPA